MRGKTMNNKYWFINLECIGLQVLFSAFSLIFYNSIMPAKLFSLFTAFLLIWAIHSTFWQLGNKDRKNIVIKNNHLDRGESPFKQNRLKGAIIGLPYLVLNVMFLIITCLCNTDILVTIESVLQFTFSGFLPLPGDNLGREYFIPRLIVCFIMYIPCVTAYFSGSYNFSLTEKILPKIIYKTRSDEKGKNIGK